MSQNNTNLRLPPPNGHSFLKNNWEMLLQPLQFMSQSIRETGDFCLIDMAHTKLYVTSDPDCIQHILQKNNKNYIKHSAINVLKRMTGNGLLASDGDFWRRQRRMAQPAFYKKQLEGLYVIMQEVVADYSKKLEGKRGQQVSIFEEMADMTLDLVMRALFSSGLAADEYQQSYHSLEFLLDYIGRAAANPINLQLSYLNGKYFKFKYHLNIIDKIVNRIIAERQQLDTQKADLLGMLIDARDADTNEQMTTKQLRDEVITFFVAGHEASSVGLAWTWYFLAKHPNVRQKVLEEVNRVLGDRMASFSDLMQLTYTKQVIDESMRMCPPAWAVGREALEEDAIKGFRIPKGAGVGIFIYGAHHNPKYWDEPHVFRPERFEREKVKKRHKYAYLPFGGGPRLCIGDRFAGLASLLAISTLVRKFNFERIDKVEAKLYVTATLRARGGLPMQVK